MRWKDRQKRDPFVKKARELNLISRAVFKLKEITKKYKLYKANDLILDLGAAPGSWSKFLDQSLGPKGRLISVDILPIPTFSKKHLVLQQDIRNPLFKQQLLEATHQRKIKALFCDIAPNITGIREYDNKNIYELAECVYDIALQNLKPNGSIVIKLFESQLRQEFTQNCRKHFREVKIFKPQASRSESREIYLIASTFLPITVPPPSNLLP